MKPFQLLIKPSGPDCNLQCTYCFYRRVAKNFPSGKHLMSDEILEEMINTGNDPSDIIDDKGLSQISDQDELDKIADKVIANNQTVAADYRAGKEVALKFLMGQIMKETKGSANPQIVEKILKEKLS